MEIYHRYLNEIVTQKMVSKVSYHSFLFDQQKRFFFPDGDINKPAKSLLLCLKDIFPDLIGDNLYSTNNFEKFTICFLLKSSFIFKFL